MRDPRPDWREDRHRKSIREAIVRYEAARDAMEAIQRSEDEYYCDTPEYQLACAEWNCAEHRMEAAMLRASCRVAVLGGRIFAAITAEELEEQEHLGRLPGRVIDLDVEPPAEAAGR